MPSVFDNFHMVDVATRHTLPIRWHIAREDPRLTSLTHDSCFRSNTTAHVLDHKEEERFILFILL